ncbi:thioesterase [Musa troglodytarum]|uniref:Thioesterase n=1 Tax=Musa troglodytarum TaxID=320322 RepID=A0A9E7I2U0_9LILI|nr:thioesterase [Musa troglodytarum]
MYHSPMINALCEAPSNIFKRFLDLIRMTHSVEVVHKNAITEQDEHHLQLFEIGKLLEDLDALAGTIAMKVATRLSLYVPPVSIVLMMIAPQGLLLVTASVDKMVLKRPLRVDTDLKIAGAFTWVGHSSIEVQIEVIQQGPETEQEKLLFEEGEERDKVRKGKREEQKRTFDNGEHSLHGNIKRLKMLAEGCVFCDLPALADRDSIQTRDTKLENLLICQPQQRNFHCRIFGGFLMNLAFELAFLTAYAFVGQVDLRDFLRLKSCVLYTQLDSPAQSLINVEVVAYVMRPELRTSEKLSGKSCSLKKQKQGIKFEKANERNRKELLRMRLKTLLAEGRVFCDLPALADRDSILIRDTKLENSLICQPQQRNLHGRIFGGFLMNLAFELAFSTAYAFVGQMPCFLEVDHVDFLKPVDVGDFLRLKSCVLYTQLENPAQPLINVEVVAHVTRPELRTSEISNTFYFTFTVNPDALKNGLKIRNVVPATEEEARRVLERMDAEEIYA